MDINTAYELHILKQDDGHFQRLVPTEEFTLVKTAQEVGAFSFIVAAELVDWGILAKDARVIVWRKPVGGTKKIFLAGFIRYRESFYEDGMEKFIVAGPDYTEILKRRISAYDAGSAYCTKDAAADNMMKAFVRENLGALCVDTTRDLSSHGFTVAADKGEGTVIKKEAARRYIFEICQEISLESKKTMATATYFAVEPTGENGFGIRFTTKVGQPGQDHRFPDGEDGPVWFAVERGNMAEPRYIEDSYDEINYVYSAGMGEEEDRTVAVVSDTVRMAHSIINRREGLFDGRNVETEAELTDAGNELLAEGVPVSAFIFIAMAAKNAVFGIHFDLGDRVTASYKKLRYDMFVISVTIKVVGDIEIVELTLAESL